MANRNKESNGKKSQKKQLCDSFMGIPWDASIDEAKTIFAKKDEVTFLKLDMNDPELRHFYIGGNAFDEKVDLWVLYFYKNQFYLGSIHIVKPTENQAKTTLTKVIRQLTDIYGEPVKIEDGTTYWSFELPHRPIGCWIAACSWKEDDGKYNVNLSYASGDLDLSMEEIEAKAKKQGASVRFIEQVIAD
jgi:hypothetical protein